MKLLEKFSKTNLYTCRTIDTCPKWIIFDKWRLLMDRYRLLTKIFSCYSPILTLLSSIKASILLSFSFFLVVKISFKSFSMVFFVRVLSFKLFDCFLQDWINLLKNEVSVFHKCLFLFFVVDCQQNDVRDLVLLCWVYLHFFHIRSCKKTMLLWLPSYLFFKFFNSIENLL